MMIDKIKELIDKSNLNRLQKSVAKGIVDRANEYEETEIKNRNLIEQVSGEKVSEIVLSTDWVKIYTVRGRDDFDRKNPFRSIFLSEDGWKRNPEVSPDLNSAYLSYLGNKHLGPNNQFSIFGMKMLGINL